MRLLLFGPRIFGLRTGISLGREDFARFAGQKRSTTASSADADKFVYVIKGGGLCKIGVSNDPVVRLSQLQNTFDAPIELAWVGVPNEQAVAIERDAHQLLDKYRRHGEWFEVAPDAAVGAVHAVAFKRGVPVLDLDPQQAEQIRLVGARLAITANKPSTALGRAGAAILQLIVGMVVAIGLLAFLAVRLGRII